MASKLITLDNLKVFKTQLMDKLVNGAPEALDTLKEIADALNNDVDGSIVNAINKTIAANKTAIESEAARAKAAEADKPSKTGSGASGTWGISVTGNAKTATTLQTARTINGTSFNGSANITTANWGTARTLTIGNSGKSVNGSANVSWSLAEIGALPKTTFDELFEKVNVGTTDAPEYAIKAKLGFYSTKWVSALGANSTMSTGGTGGAGNLLQAWSTTMTDDEAKTDWALSAFLGKELNTRLTSLEGGSATSITTTGSGNAVTSITKNGAAITVTKGSNFATTANAIKALSVSGRTITYTKADGTTGTITTQDTNTTYAFSNKAATLSWGTAVTVATVGGTDITVKLPANPNTDTHYATHLYVGTSTGNANAATTNGNTYLMVLDNSTVRDRRLIKGTGATTVTSDTSGNITINSTNTTYGVVTQSTNGLMTAADKKKLDGWELATDTEVTALFS